VATAVLIDRRSGAYANPEPSRFDVPGSLGLLMAQPITTEFDPRKEEPFYGPRVLKVRRAAKRAA
jgi:hypothetical protein